MLSIPPQQTPAWHLDIRSALKQHTHACHERVEQQLDLMNLTSLPRYQAILRAFAGVYQVLEPLVLDRPEWQQLDFDAGARRKRSWLQQDLQHFGLQGHAGPAGFALPTFQHALGAMYVMEGSTLGGQVIHRHLKNTLGLDAQGGARFFAGYQQQTGPMWQAFLALLTAQGTHHQQVIEGANATFQLFSEQVDRHV